MKKLLLAIFSVILIVCLGAAVACDGDSKDYYKVTFRQTNGVTYVSNVKKGGFKYGAWEVKDGATVTFKLQLSDDASGVATVYSNDDVLTADGKGTYSVTVRSNLEIRVDGIEAAGEYNRILFASAAGVSYEILTEIGGVALKNGMMVRKGTDISFKIGIADGFYGDPVVKANGTELTANEDVYTFTMNNPTTISVEGVMKNVEYTFDVNGGDTRVWYIDEGGRYYETDKPIEGKLGDEIKFKLEISVYYVQSGYEVQANNEIITPDADGYYTVILENDKTTFSVSKLEQDEPYTSRANGGSGSQRDPFRLSRPIDLYQMAMLINSEFYTQDIYRIGYYELENDIDLKGEQLYVIGDGGNGYAYFAGSFNGKGHTISNFYITDSRVEQTDFNTLYLSNVGMFGCVMPSINRAPSITNLNLDTFSITASASHSNVTDQYTMCVGSLAGSTYGAVVSNVSATNGYITVTGGQQSGAYVGGLIGQQMSEYGGSSIAFASSVTRCMTDVDISVTGGFSYVYATGGIVGVLASNSPDYTAYVLNSYATGSIEGGQHAGGIAGYVAANTAVANCYSTGDVRAVSPFTYNADYYDSVYYANAGGIAGCAVYNSVVSGSFSKGYISGQSTRGNSYLRVSSTVGYVNGTLPDVGSVAPTLINLYGGENLTVNQQLITNLHWSENDWSFAGALPVLNAESTANSLSITFEVDSGFSGGSKPIGNTMSGYDTMSGWYNNGYLAEYVVGSGGNRSYGYFFDENCENKVPSSFIPTYNITLYVGYANYADVAGVYYLGDSVYDAARIEFDEDGTFVYRNGALNHPSTYTWDGTTMVLYNTSLGELTKLQVPEAFYSVYFGTYYTFGATLSNGVISVTGGAVQELAVENGETYYTGETIYLFPENQPLTGLSAIADFHYGDYYDGIDIYTFNGNGTGLWVSGNERSFTYYVSGVGKLALMFDGDAEPVEATFDGGYVTAIGRKTVMPFDGFTGAWERAFSVDGVYYFDGKNTWTYTVGVSVNTGTYTIDNGTLTDDGGTFTAEFEGGFLKIATSGANAQELTYYKQGSFVGEWTYSGENVNGFDTTITLILDGIGTEGYGEAYVEYAAGAQFDLTYEAVIDGNDISLVLFDGGTLFGQLEYNSEDVTLSGLFYDSVARFTVFDDLKGIWISDDEEIKSASFNGSGFYNLAPLNKGANRVKGTVRINDSTRAEYTFNRVTLTGSFTYKTVNYTFAYDQYANVIEVSVSGGRHFILTTRDMWYGVELIDSEGFVYTFDGLGELANGGRLSVSNGNLVYDRYYGYKIVGDTITLTGNITTAQQGGTITLGQDAEGKAAYVLEQTNGSKIYLYLNTPFTGAWIIGGAKGTISIGKVYADNTASGKYTPYGQSMRNIALTYDPDGKYLTFIDSNTPHYLNALVSDTAVELSFGLVNSVSGAGNVICIPAGKADEMYGKVFTTDDGYTLLFDGLTTSVFAIGSVIVLDGHGVVEVTYTYEYNDYGYVTVILDYFWEYVFVPCKADTEFEVDVLYRLTDEEDNNFAIVATDGLYTLKIADGDDAGVYYDFDGAGKVTRVDGEEKTVYSYKIVNIDDKNFKHTLEFTAEDGTVYTVTLDMSSEERVDWNLKFNTINTANGFSEIQGNRLGV